MSALRVRLVGPKVRPGKIRVEDLRLLADAIETSLLRFAERKVEGLPSLRRGPRTKSSRSLVNLYVTGIERGSTTLVFEPGPGQTDLTGERLGIEIFEEWVDGARSLQDPNRLPPDTFDRGVLSSLHLLHPILTKDVDRLEIEWNGNHRTSKAVFDSGTAKRTETLLQRPTQNRRSVTGIILQADFHAPDVAFTVYSTEGESTRCTASEDDLGTVLSALMHVVRVSGEALVDPTTNAVLSLRADTVEPEGEGEFPGIPYSEVREFYAAPDFDALTSRQGIPIFDSSQPTEWEAPSDQEWENYERAILARRRRSPTVP